MQKNIHILCLRLKKPLQFSVSELLVDDINPLSSLYETAMNWFLPPKNILSGS